MTILCYHAVESGWASPLAVTPQAFESQSAWLAGHRTVLPLEEAVVRVNKRGQLPRGYAAMTFDDGFASLYEHAFETLQRHRLASTIFLVAATLTPEGAEVDWVDTPPRHRMRTLSLDQITEMQSAGVRFESHSRVHADLTQLSFEECVRDLRESREFLSDLLDHDVRFLAYPRGRHNSQVRDAARRAGYDYALALPEGPEPVGQFSVPRVGVYRGNTNGHLRVKASTAYLPVRTGRPYAALRAARHGVAG